MYVSFTSKPSTHILAYVNELCVCEGEREDIDSVLVILLTLTAKHRWRVTAIVWLFFCLSIRPYVGLSTGNTGRGEYLHMREYPLRLHMCRIDSGHD